jgi:hypothetical protein
MFKTAIMALGFGLAAMVTADQADARRWNPPGPAGGPGTNWRNPPGPVGGPGASRHHWNPPGPIGGPGAGPYWRNRGPGPYAYYAYAGTTRLYWHPQGFWCRFDRDDNPPGPRGGRGTNWENLPGPRGGRGASPNSRFRRC